MPPAHLAMPLRYSFGDATSPSSGSGRRAAILPAAVLGIRVRQNVAAVVAAAAVAGRMAAVRRAVRLPGLAVLVKPFMRVRLVIHVRVAAAHRRVHKVCAVVGGRRAALPQLPLPLGPPPVAAGRAVGLQGPEFFRV
jgi:hypothetical protein